MTKDTQQAATKPRPTLPWQKCPAVTTGGKTFFFYSRPYHVVWDRIAHVWAAQRDHVTFAHYPTPQAAKIACEIDCQKAEGR